MGWKEASSQKKPATGQAMPLHRRLPALIKRKQPLMKVNFMIAGTQKEGTTTLAEYLSNHPQLPAIQKELHFFDDERQS